MYVDVLYWNVKFISFHSTTLSAKLFVYTNQYTIFDIKDDVNILSTKSAWIKQRNTCLPVNQSI